LSKLLHNSNIIIKSDGISQNYVYLHRDYQGILEIKKIFIPDPNNNDGSGWNGYRIDGGLEYDPNMFGGTPHTPVFLSKGGGVFGYFPKTNTKTPTGAFL
jgi:hypothetical protein